MRRGMVLEHRKVNTLRPLFVSIAIVTHYYTTEFKGGWLFTACAIHSPPLPLRILTPASTSSLTILLLAVPARPSPCPAIPLTCPACPLQVQEGSHGCAASDVEVLQQAEQAGLQGGTALAREGGGGGGGEAQQRQAGRQAGRQAVRQAGRPAGRRPGGQAARRPGE